MDASIITYLREFRIGGFTVFDASLSFLGMYILSPLLSKLFRYFGLEVPRSSWILLVLPIAIIAHSLSGTSTTLTREVLNPSGFYFEKLVILALLILGLKDVKRAAKAGKLADEKSSI